MYNDLRFALRMLRKKPSFTAVSVLTLGLGIGLVSTQFSLIDGVLLPQLPFRDSERLFHIGRWNENAGEQPWRPMLIREFLAHREQQASFDDLAAFRSGTFNLNHASAPPRRLRGTAVTANFFNLLRMTPQVGRAFQPGEDQPGFPLLIILSNAVWQEEFGGDPAVLGRAARINDEPGIVIGVMPAGFRFPHREECWINLRLQREVSAGRELQSVAAMGLLKPGVSAREATAELEVIARRQQQAFPEEDPKPARMNVNHFPMAYSTSAAVTLLYTMLAMTGLVLALACGNVASLLFARAAGRLRELAVRAALGAGRYRIVRQLLIESLVLSGLGALLGTMLSAWGVSLLDAQVSTRLEASSWIHVELNARVFAFTTAIAVAAGLLTGLLPAFRVSRLNLGETLKDDTRGAGLRLGGFSRWLVTGQFAFACALAIAALLLALSAVRSSRVNLVFNPDSLLIGRIELEGSAYENPQTRVRFYSRLVDQVRAVPGVAAAAVSSRDLVDSGIYTQFEIEGAAYQRKGEKPSGWLEVVSRGYFEVLERGALRGRLFGSEDSSTSQPVALVNQSFATKHWPGADPIGRRFRRSEAGARWVTIIGVVPDLNMEGVGNSDPPAGWYLLQDQQARGELDLLVRTRNDPKSIIAAVRAAITGIDPDQPIQSVTNLSERTARRAAGLEIAGAMAGVFALTALLLAGVGIYGVMSFMIGRRTREFGLRIALGATGATILSLVLRQNIFQTVVGVIAGLSLGYALSLQLSFLPKVSVTDPRVYAGVALALAAVALIAIGIPARRATKVDPIVALRCE